MNLHFKGHYHYINFGRTAAILSAWLLPWGAFGATVGVTISNFSFQPSSLTITQADSVVWTQMDSTIHTSTSDTTLWDSGSLTADQTFTNTFPNAGTFPYHCIPHASFMKASVTVQAAPTNAPPAQGSGYVQHNLVSDLPGQADVTDARLVNPWAIATSGTSPFWISDNHSGFSTLYNSTGGVSSLVVTIPPPTNGQPPASPTGMVFNGNTNSFLLGTNLSARFIFATEDGTISGWNSGSNAVLKVDNSSSNAIYKGLALATSGGSNFLYATDFHNGKVDVFDSAFNPVPLAGGFADPSLPAGYAPFGIQNLGGDLYVTYALQDADAEDDVAGAGHGFVNVFDTTGKMLKRFASEGVLNSPWGLAKAPLGFGQFSGALLIGNFGDGRINGFDPVTGTELGALSDTNGTSISIEGLWGLKFGNGGQGGAPFKLYFTAGISGGGSVEDHGLFGSLAPADTIVLSVETVYTNALTLAWSEGIPPFLVQRKTALTDPNWFDVVTTSNRTAIVADDATPTFYRVLDHAPTNVTAFTVLMSGAAEVPPVSSSGTGFGILSLEGNTLSYHIGFSGLSGPAIASHIHGIADTTQPAGVITPLNFPAAASGVLSGTVDVGSYTPAQLEALKSGKTYVNIHTAANGNGEIRGQIAPANYTASLTGAAETPPVTTSGTGSGSLTLIGNQLFWTVTYSGLSTNAIAAHVHGAAPVGQPAGVLFPIGNPTGTSGTLNGTQTLKPDEFADLLNGLTYVNVHTVTNGGGEIRGQIVPP
jgi:uncharacterized protein (TIGR03118 family)